MTLKPFGLTSGPSLRGPRLEAPLRRGSGQASTRSPRARLGANEPLNRPLSRGFGLIGIVIAALILAVVVPPLFSLFSGSLRTVTRSEAALLASIASGDLMERVTDPRFALARAGESFEVPGVRGLRLMEPFATRYRAKARIEIEPVAGHTNPATGREEAGLLRVLVRVTWEEGDASHSLDTATMLADVAALRPTP